MIRCLIPVAAALGGADHPGHVRFATFNIWELTTTKLEQVDRLGRGTNPQLQGAAEIIQRIRPDVLLINEIDFDAQYRANAQLFIDRYLMVSQQQQKPISYPHVFFEAVNTGLPTGMDLDNDGKMDGPADAFGFGRYPGQYGMALLSRFPIHPKEVRTFQDFLWRGMPDNLMPDGSHDKPGWYNAKESAIFRLASKSFWDVPITLGGSKVIHVLACHPTPPVFDGPEDRNGRRNHDEIRMLVDYVTSGAAAEYLVDDRGRRGGLDSGTSFVVLGDLNADPEKDPAAYGRPAIVRLLSHPRVHDPMPTRHNSGRPETAEVAPAARTCEFGRIDYALPSKGLRLHESGVYSPDPTHPQYRLVQETAASSDHRLVWVDLVWDAEQDNPIP